MNQNDNKSKTSVAIECLKKRNFNVIDLIGAVVTLIVEKEYLKRNADVGQFVETIFDEKFPEYVIKSRTLMAARISRELLEREREDVGKIRWEILEYIQEADLKKKEDTIIEVKKSKKRNENDKLEKWLRGL